MWLLLLVLAIALIYLLAYLYATRNFNYWKKKNIAYEKPVSFFGNLKDFVLLRRSPYDILEDIYFKDDLPYKGLFFFDQPTLMVRDTELIKNILIKDFDNFMDRSFSSNTKSDPLGGNMLFILKGDLWRDIRRKLTPVFTSGKVKALFPITSESGKKMVEYMGKICKPNAEIDAKEIAAVYATENIVSTAFGIEADCFGEKESEFKKVAIKMFDFNDFWMALSQTLWFFAPRFVEWFSIPFIDKACSGFMAKAFWGAMQEREKTRVKRNDLIDILLSMREKRELEDEHILGQGIQFFTAGYETTSSTIAFALYILSLNKDVQSKLREEIHGTIEKCGGLTYEALQTMSYLDMVVKESMRINPVIPILLRTCNKDYQIPGTKDVIEKGTTVVLYPLGMHHDPKYFPEPKKFIPERFSEENAANINPMAYLPFGEGPRNCIDYIDLIMWQDVTVTEPPLTKHLTDDDLRRLKGYSFGITGGRRFGLNSTKSGLSNIINKFEIESCAKTHKEIKAHIMGHNYASQDNKIVLNFKSIKQ